jgi:hypothetical protein
MRIEVITKRRTKRRRLEPFARIRMVTETVRAMGSIHSQLVLVRRFVKLGPLLGHELFGGNRGIGIVIVFFVEIGEWFTEVFDLEIWANGSEVKGVDLDRANKAW